MADFGISIPWIILVTNRIMQLDGIDDDLLDDSEIDTSDTDSIRHVQTLDQNSKVVLFDYFHLTKFLQFTEFKLAWTQ